MTNELINTKFYSDANLVSYWRFEGNSNDSKSSNNGTDTDMIYGTDYGKFNQGASFNGTSSRILLPNNASLRLSSPYTISAWVKTSVSGTGNYFYILGKANGNNDTYGYEFFVYGLTGVVGFYVDNTATGNYLTTSNSSIKANDGKWHHIVGTATGSLMSIYIDGMLINTMVQTFEPSYVNEYNGYIGACWSVNLNRPNWYAAGTLDDLAIFSRALSLGEVQSLYNLDKNKYTNGINSNSGNYPSADNSSVDNALIAWKKLQVIMRKSINGGQCFNSNPISSTYPLIYTVTTAYGGGVLDSNGDLHFVPLSATVGQKISASGVVSTYSLIYTVATAYVGGVLAPNGDIHFVPYKALVGQKISASGVVSTYSLAYTHVNGTAAGGVVGVNGDIYFIVNSGAYGQKISTSGVISTYTSLHTKTDAYGGGCLAPNGDIHFTPAAAAVGQKISAAGVVSTYSLIYTNNVAAYQLGGILAPNGDIHFPPYTSTVGQKIDINGVVSTYSIVTTNNSGAFIGGCLTPTGDILMFPFFASVGMKIDKFGVVSSFSLAYTTSVGFEGSVLMPNGDVHLIPRNTSIGQKISTLPGIPFEKNLCLSPFFNKL